MLFARITLQLVGLLGGALILDVMDGNGGNAIKKAVDLMEQLAQSFSIFQEASQ